MWKTYTVFPMNVSFRQLHIAASVARCRSITAASRELSLSPSGVAAALDSLESELGVRLFDRRPAKGVSITPAGRDVVARAVTVLAEMDGFKEHAFKWAHSLSGEIRIACFAPLSPLVFPLVLKEFIGRYPNVTVRLQEGTSTEIETALRDDKADVILTYDFGLRQDLPREVLASAPTHVVLAEDAPEARHSELHLSELADQPMILFDQPVSRDYFVLLFRERNLQPRILVRTQYYQTLCELVGAGLGYSLLNLRPPTGLSYHGYRLVRRPLADDLVSPSIVLSYPVRAGRSRIADAFGTICKQQIQASILRYTLAE